MGRECSREHIGSDGTLEDKAMSQKWESTAGDLREEVQEFDVIAAIG